MVKLLVVLVVVISISIRLFLFSQSLSSYFGAFYELVTPISDHKRVLEGLFLIDNGLSPYSGSQYHESPLLLSLFSLLKGKDDLFLHLLYTGMDVVIGLLIFGLARNYRKKFVENELGVSQMVVREDEFEFINVVNNRLPEILLSAYLLNPYSIISCLSLSTVIFNNLFIVSSLYFIISGNLMLSVLFCSLSTYVSIYSFGLLPAIIAVHMKLTKKKLFNVAFQTTILFLCFLGQLLYISYLQLGEDLFWQFLEKSYWFTIVCEDLQPNIGIFWYYFTEVFMDFRPLFIFAFQFNVVLYSIPLATRLKDHPVFVFWAITGIMCTFKSYPSVGDCVLFLSLVPLFQHKLHEMNHPEILFITYLTVTFLTVLFWKLWIVNGTGNANFYYAISLVIVFCNSYIINDATSSITQREYLAKNNQ